MELSSFLSLNHEEIAAIVRADGPKVCVCPINGTRRWFMLEHAFRIDLEENGYFNVTLGKYMEIFRLFFMYGIDTVLSPIFGPDLFSRGEDYLDVAIQGMKDLVTADEFRDFIMTNQVRVRFYGDYVRHFRGTRFEFLIHLFESLTAETRHHARYRLFWGVFGNDATEQVAEIGARFFMRENRYPSRKEIIEAYYGEYVKPVSLFIGYDKLSAFDMPILATGEEDLYFTTSPTPYLTERQLRLILFDHVVSRKGEPDYASFELEDWERMRLFYENNRENTIGVGTKLRGVWYPLSQVNEIENILIH